MNNPKISVILPVFNGERFLEEAIASMMHQGIHNIEMIAVDDGSTDGTAGILQKYAKKIRIISQPNQGPASARNLGIKASVGELIAFLDADDLFEKSKLTDLLHRLEQDPHAGIAMGYIRRFQSPGIAVAKHLQVPDTEQPKLSLHLGSALIRRQVFDQIGLLEENMHFSEDIDWFLRAIENGIRFSILPKPVYCYRIHNENMTLDAEQSNRYLLRAFSRSLSRRRKQNSKHPAPLPDIRNPGALEAFLKHQKTEDQ